MSKDIDHILEKARIDARKDVVKEFFVKNSKIIIRLSLVFLIVALAIVVNNAIKAKRQAEYSTILHQAHIAKEEFDLLKAKNLLKEIINSDDAPLLISTLANLRYAELILQENNFQQALDIFIKIANCQSCEDFAQDLAKLLAVKVWMMNDNMQKDDGLLSQMQEFAKKAKYLKDHIDEQMALYEKNQGNLQKSYEIFSKIVDRIDGYQAVKDRAQEQISELMTKIKIKDENNSKK